MLLLDTLAELAAHARAVDADRPRRRALAVAQIADKARAPCLLLALSVALICCCCLCLFPYYPTSSRSPLIRMLYGMSVDVCCADRAFKKDLLRHCEALVPTAHPQGVLGAGESKLLLDALMRCCK